jgi:hypothetical protein
MEVGKAVKLGKLPSSSSGSIQRSLTPVIPKLIKEPLFK